MTILVSRDVAGTNIGNGPVEQSGHQHRRQHRRLRQPRQQPRPELLPDLDRSSNYQVYASTLNGSTTPCATTKLVSVDPTGTTAGNGTFGIPEPERQRPDGRVPELRDKPCEHSRARRSVEDVYVRNLATNTTHLVSVYAGGHGRRRLQLIRAADQRRRRPRPVLQSGRQPDGQRTTPLRTNVFERNLTTNTTQLGQRQRHGHQ